jgi:enoyl-CoA hydratase/carnithine racemase
MSVHSVKYGDVALTRQGAVALVELQRPPHNYFDAALIEDVARACAEVDADPALRAIVLCAQGQSFCAGASFSGQEEGADFAEVVATRLYAAAARLFEVQTPIVAAINGAAVGGGLGLALVADFRVASAESRLAANFVKVGIHPGFGLTVTLPRLIGEQRAALMFLTGRRLNGEAALAFGLVDELAPAAGLRDHAVALAEEIAGNAPLAVVATRRTLRADVAERVRRRTEHERLEQGRLMETDDYREGVQAVAERRAGRFHAR